MYDFSMFDRKLPNPRPEPIPESRLRYRIETLIGITGAKMAKYRDSWYTAVFAILNVVWRPHLLLILIFEVRPCSYHSSARRVTDALWTGYGLRVQYWYQREFHEEISALSHTHRGLQTTNAVFLGTPEPEGYGFSQFGIAGAYGTPIVSGLGDSR